MGSFCFELAEALLVIRQYLNTYYFMLSSIFYSPSVFSVVLLFRQALSSELNSKMIVSVCAADSVKGSGTRIYYACVFNAAHVFSTQTCSVKHYVRPLYSDCGVDQCTVRPPPPAYIYNSRTAIPLMWGSLRLAPVVVLLAMVL